MSEFTSSLGNPNDYKNFIKDMRMQFNIYRKCRPNGFRWNDIYKCWIIRSISEYSKIIDNYKHLQNEGIEEINRAIELVKTHMPTEEEINISSERLYDLYSVINQLEDSISEVIADYDNKQQQQKLDAYRPRWLSQLSDMEGKIAFLKKCNPSDFTDIRYLKEIAKELDLLVESLRNQTPQPESQKE